MASQQSLGVIGPDASAASQAGQDIEKQAKNTQNTNNGSGTDPAPPDDGEQHAPHTIFTKWEKRFIVLVASAAGFFSPISANIYFPALNSLASEYAVSTTLVNLTVTVYMIFQGLAPSFTGSLSDNVGRRPVYFLCFALYIGANVGLALQHSFVALIVLRCVQSSGSSGTVALANAVVSDVATAAERGVYIAYASIGGVLGIALGPILGGILSSYLGWRAIFWFLTICAGVVVLALGLFLPETARSVVDNGSVPPPSWNTSLWDHLPAVKRRKAGVQQRGTGGNVSRKAVINPFAALKICFDKEASIVLLANGLSFAGYFAVATAIPSQFARIYGFDDLKIGLCFIPVGVSSGISTILVGRAVDWNFARHARRLGLSPLEARQKNRELGNFPIERVRCEIALPLLLLGSVSSVAYGWVLDYETSVAGPLVSLFFVGFAANGVFTILSVLMVDMYPHAPATATAANNLVRCWLGAAASVLIIPMIDRMTSGWAYTFFAFLYLLLVPLLGITMRWGPKWRVARTQREKEQAGS